MVPRSQRQIHRIGTIVFLAFWVSSCATTGPTLMKAEIEKAKEEFNAKFFEAAQIWLPRVYRVGYRILKTPVPGLAAGEPKFNFIGVGVTDLKDYARKVYGIEKSVKGVLVLGVYPDSPSQGLDILPGDVIVALDGKKTTGLGAYFRRLKDSEGKTLQLKIWRKGETLEREVPIEKVYYKAQFFLEPTPDLEASASWSRINVGIGALRYSRNDDELAFIMGHELAHVTRKHKAKELGAQLGTAVAYGVMAGVIEAFTFPGLGRAVMDPAQAATDAAVSREYEREADYFGMQHAFHAGYDMDHGSHVMSRLSTDAPGFQVLAFTFASHPVTPERYLRIKKTVEEFQTQYPDRFPMTPSPDWELHVPIRAGETVEEALARLVENRVVPSQTRPVVLPVSTQGVVLGAGKSAALLGIPASTGTSFNQPDGAAVFSASSSGGAGSSTFESVQGISQRTLPQNAASHVTPVAAQAPLYAAGSQIFTDRLAGQGVEMTAEQVPGLDTTKDDDAEEKLRLAMLKLAEAEKQIDALKRQGKVDETEGQLEAAERMSETMTRFEIESIGLSRDVDNLLVGSRVKGRDTKFSVSGGKVVWFCKFKPGFRNVVAAISKPQLMASWFAPDGSLYQEETFTVAFGNAQLARNELKLDAAHPEHLLGRWRVIVHYGDELLDERSFRVVR